MWSVIVQLVEAPADDASIADSTRSLTESELFNFEYTEERARIPVVNISLDLTQHFKTDDETGKVHDVPAY